MAFEVSETTLLRLEWPAVAARLAEALRTPQARRRLREAGAAARILFADDEADVRARLAETSEARRLLDAGESPPLGGGSDLAEAQARLRRGGELTARELLELASTLGVLRETGRYLRAHAGAAPVLTLHAERIADLGELEAATLHAIGPEGEVRDEASEALREARREARGLCAELTRRVEEMLRDPELLAALSDRFYTVRSDRYVLPVRADARRRVPGIVHDASASGSTLFVEPQAMVDLNNRLKEVELAAQREVRRILRELSARAARELPRLEAGLAALEAVDLACARGALSRAQRAVEPEVGRAGIFRLPVLRHPLLAADEVVPNDVHLGESFTVLVLSGPNAGGKTVALKAVALCALFVRAGLHVPAAPGARVDLVDAVLSDIGDAQDLEAHLSTFSAHVANLARILERASERTLVVLDEIGVGTDPTEGAALAQAVLEALADAGARVVTTTHMNLLKEIAALDPRFENGCVEFDPVTLAPTFRLRFGLPGISTATALAARMGLRPAVVERARALLEGEESQLQGLLTELARSRVALDGERAELARRSAEIEAVRDQYAERLAELRERRRKLVRRLREDLEREFREARAQVAAVVRDLQRGGTAKEAAQARERLAAIESELAERIEAADPGAPGPDPLDWARVQVGAAVRLEGGRSGVLLALPDRRGRATVQVGSARMQVPRERIEGLAVPAPEARPAARVSFERAASEEPVGDTAECDLRGLRSDEALEKVDAALDRALSRGYARVRLIHGHGTGSLREAVRAHLAALPHVREFRPGEEREGGNGVTVAVLDD